MKPASELLDGWRALRTQEPPLRQRDAAHQLGVTEAELVAAYLPGSPDGKAILLDGRWMEILTALEGCGPVTGLTRNETAVLEEKGAYFNISGKGDLAQMVGPHLDLRLFLARWRHGFALTEQLADGPRRSVQFFDDRGMAIHKVFLGPESKLIGWEALLASHGVEAERIDPPATAEPKSERPDAEIDREGLAAGWAALQDTHEFHGLLRRFGVARTQAMRLCPQWARPVSILAHRPLFEACRDQELPLMVFVGNRGIIQIHTGPPRKLVQMGSWFNVLDRDWNLHLREVGVDSAWVVRKPTRDGVVSSLELFDREGEIIALFFSKRHDGEVERATWSNLLGSLQSAGPSSRSG